MGASISRSATPTELAALLPMLGAAYEAYASIVVDNGVNGSFIFSFSTKEEIAETLVDLGVTNKAHHRLITTCILEAIEAEAAAHSTVFASPSSSSPSHPAPAQSPLASAAGGGSASPSSFTCAPTDVFLTHNWNNGNHARVSGVNRGLQSRGVVTWFDSDRMTGSIRKTMTDGIENTQCVMVFITREYRDKVNGADARDNCQYEFNHAVEQLGPQRMIPVVMEAEMRTSRDWRGVLGAALGTLLYVDMVGIDESKRQAFEAKMDELAALVRGIAGGGSGLAAGRGKAAATALIPSASMREADEEAAKEGQNAANAAAAPAAIETERARAAQAKKDEDERKAREAAAAAERVRAAQAKKDEDERKAREVLEQQRRGTEASILAAVAANPYAGRYASKSQADIAANRAKRAPDGASLGFFKPKVVGRQIYDASSKGDLAALRPLADEWFANDVLNWEKPDSYPRGNTPLIISSANGKMEAVRLLLATPGVDINKTCGGWTAIMWAAGSGHDEVVIALLAPRLNAPGIDLKKRVTDGPFKGKTALGFAIMYNKLEAAALLRAAGAEE